MSGKYSKHINEGQKITIDGDEFILKAAGSDKVVKPYFQLMKSFSKVKQDKSMTDEETSQQMMASFDDATADAVRILIEETLKASYPDEDENEMKQFAMKHLMTLMPVIIQLYTPSESANVEQKKKLDVLLKRKV